MSYLKSSLSSLSEFGRTNKETERCGSVRTFTIWEAWNVKEIFKKYYGVLVKISLLIWEERRGNYCLIIWRLLAAWIASWDPVCSFLLYGLHAYIKINNKNTSLFYVNFFYFIYKVYFHSISLNQKTFIFILFLTYFSSIYFLFLYFFSPYQTHPSWLSKWNTNIYIKC